MSLVLPEISLLKALEGLIKWLKFNHEDFVEKDNEKGSFLYRLFGTTEHNGFSYYDEAKRIFLSDPLDQRKLGVRIFFDASRAHVPTIHITLPGESHQDSGLGMNTDGVGFERQQNTRYSLVITSDNYSEVIIIYYTIRSLLISGFMTLENYGIRNMKLSGGDLTLQQDIVPSNVYFRAIFIDMLYDEVIPDMEYDSDDIIRGIYLQGRVVEGAGELPPIPDPSPEFRLKHNRLDEESRALPNQHPTDAIRNESKFEGENLTEVLDYLKEYGVTLDNIAGILDPQDLHFSDNFTGTGSEQDPYDVELPDAIIPDFNPYYFKGTGTALDPIDLKVENLPSGGGYRADYVEVTGANVFQIDFDTLGDNKAIGVGVGDTLDIHFDIAHSIADTGMLFIHVEGVVAAQREYFYRSYNLAGITSNQIAMISETTTSLYGVARISVTQYHITVQIKSFYNNKTQYKETNFITPIKDFTGKEIIRIQYYSGTSTNFITGSKFALLKY